MSEPSPSAAVLCHRLDIHQRGAPLSPIAGGKRAATDVTDDMPVSYVRPRMGLGASFTLGSNEPYLRGVVL
jgi:hypothetical protein